MRGWGRLSNEEPERLGNGKWDPQLGLLIQADEEYMMRDPLMSIPQMVCGH